MSFREYIEKELNERKGEFENTFKIALDDITKIPKNKDYKADEQAALLLMYKGDKHVMTYNKKKGELMTDLSIEQVEKLIKK